MRVAILAGFPPHVLPGFDSLRPAAGHTTWLPQLAQSLANQTQYQLDWISVTPDIVEYQSTKCYSQTFHFLPASKRFRAIRAFRPDTRAIGRLLDTLEPDLVHAWGTETCYGLAAIRSERPFLLSMQGILLYLVSHVQMHPRWYLQAFYEWQVLRRAKYISSESEWGAAVLRSYAPGARIWRIEYGVNPLFYETKWNPAPDRPVAIFVGATVKRKGLHDAVAAFRDDRLAHAELWILGDKNSNLSRSLRRKSPPRIKWLGHQSVEATARLMSEAWCLVLPTQADTSPNVVKEACVIGMPVVTTARGGQRAYIEHGKNGFIVEPADVPELTEKLRTLLGDLTVCQSMGAHLHTEHRKFFAPGNTASAFLSVYDELLEAGKR